MVDPIWLSHARGELGVKEVSGDGDNPRIIKYWQEAGLANVADGQDEVPWCAAFVNAMLARAKIAGTDKANARSFEAWGRKLNSPALGCVVILSRPPTAWQGHVALYLGTDKIKRTIRVIGGNQGDSVSIADFSLDRLVGYRWPANQPLIPEWVGPLPIIGTAQMSTSEA